MATTYVVFGVVNADEEIFRVVGSANAASADQARRLVAENMPDEELSGDGVALYAVPLRNWRGGRGTVKAETTRRIRSS